MWTQTVHAHLKFSGDLVMPTLLAQPDIEEPLDNMGG